MAASNSNTVYHSFSGYDVATQNATTQQQSVFKSRSKLECLSQCSRDPNCALAVFNTTDTCYLFFSMIILIASSTSTYPIWHRPTYINTTTPLYNTIPGIHGPLLVVGL